MSKNDFPKIRSVPQLYELLPHEECMMLDMLRSLIREYLPDNFKEKISYNVPYFYGNKGICIIWPSTIPRGGFKKGVLLGFWYGNLLNDPDHYLEHGTNKQIFYKIYHSVSEIDPKKIQKLLNQAIVLDKSWKNKK